ncbi:MAG TPA: hypothetical protein VGB92_11945, partial [Longimicrobium sp.]
MPKPAQRAVSAPEMADDEAVSVSTPPASTSAPDAAPAQDAGSPSTAALAEVLVRLLERDGPVMRAESSLRRLLVQALGRELGLGAPQQEALGLAALLGDLGGSSGEPGRNLAVTLQLLSGVALPEAAREAL